ncbi:MAG TPA: glycosyltransferase family 4 protein [Myxococcota bacterium]|nr:glycosyltransferase family 4 protein [Myxococcota bacterium]
MRILFLTHYYPPEVNAPANRVHEHARAWVNRGHEVTVITGVPNHPRGELFAGYQNRWLQEERIDGVRVLRTWMYVTANEGFVRRTANYVAFMLTAILASFRAERPDVVVATSPQFFCGIAGAVVGALKRRPFVLEVRDLWPESIVALGQLRRGSLPARLLERVERWLYRRARGVVVVTRAFARHIARAGVPERNIALVYNGIDGDMWRPRTASPALLARHGIGGEFRVGYVGTLGLAHGLMTVLEAAQKLADPSVHFVFVGDGADRARVEQEAKQRGLANVHFTGLLPRSEVPDWLASLDVLLVMLRDLPVFETVIPSKLFEFAAMERPVILSAPHGEVREMVESAGAGVAIDAEDAAQLASAIDALRREPERARALGARARAWAESGFRREVQAQHMVRFFEECAA